MTDQQDSRNEGDAPVETHDSSTNGLINAFKTLRSDKD